MRFLSVVGARPQFVKASALSRVLRKKHEEHLVHTGQHYDQGMSEIFFRELGIPEPAHNLGVGSGSHGAQTAAMLAGLEEVTVDYGPDAVIVYGDTNSTLAGALAAAKLHVPVAHVEAGLRSFNRRMPEEINRVVADHLATWLFAPSQASADQLAAEGITEGVHVVGDIMIDALRLFGERAVSDPRLGLRPREYYLATIHRAENTDNPDRLRAALAILGGLDRPVVLPLHPRTRRLLTEHAIEPPGDTQVIGPVAYLAMLALERDARAVLTDSGGVQKEAYHFGVPCITLRSETEWVETVEAGWNFVTDLDAARVADALARAPGPGAPRPPLYGDGHAAERIVKALIGVRDPVGIG